MNTPDPAELTTQTGGEPPTEAPVRYGDFLAVSELGRGGMGVVYKGKQLVMDREVRDVALKILRPELSSPAFINRFFSEATHAIQLEHENIVAGIHAGSANGVCYFAMEFIQGETVENVVERRGALSVGDALFLTLGAATGLACAHDHEVFHRDVKPANIMIRDGDGLVKVTDLGLAKARAEDVGRLAPGGLLGTVVYMAPEQVVSPEDADPRYDIYALGATLYYMLTAQKPFSGKTREEVLAAKKAGKYARVSTVMRDVPPAVEAIVDRMMARDPAKRPRTMAEVIAAIADTGLAHEKPSWIGPPHPPRHARKPRPWRDRRRQLTLQYTAVLVAFAMALAVATLVYRAIEGTNPPLGRTTTSDQPSPAAPPLGPPAEAFIAKALNQLNQGALAGAQQVLEEGLRVHARDERMRALGKEIAQGVVVLFERETKDGANSLLLLPAVDGLTMARGQHQYRFTVIPSAACFVYILEQDPRPEMFWIFPNERFAEDQNPLPPGMHRIPSADRWFPGDNAQGTERLYVIAVTRPLREPEAVRQQLGSDPDGLRSRLEANLESFLEPGQGQGKSCFATGSVWQSAAFSHV